MPKLKESIDNQDRLFKALVAKNMVIHGFHHNNDLAPVMHMHQQTLNYKLNDPDKFTRKELRKLFTILKFTEEEKGEVM